MSGVQGAATGASAKRRRWLPVRATQLIYRQARFSDGFGSRICLFPFFNAAGRVETVLLCEPELGEVRVLETTVAVRIPWWGPLRFQRDWMELPLLEDAPQVTKTWHYDPEWVLREPAFRHHPLRSALQQTNCVGQFEGKTTDLYFDGAIGRVKWVATGGGEGGLIKFRPKLLPPPPELKSTLAPAPQRRQWVLSPIWERA